MTIIGDNYGEYDTETEIYYSVDDMEKDMIRKWKEEKELGVRG